MKHKIKYYNFTYLFENLLYNFNEYTIIEFIFRLINDIFSYKKYIHIIIDSVLVTSKKWSPKMLKIKVKTAKNCILPNL